MSEAILQAYACIFSVVVSHLIVINNNSLKMNASEKFTINNR